MKAGLSVMVSSASRDKSGTPDPPAEQIGGMSRVAILAPMKITSAPFGKEMSASKGPAFVRDPVRATLNPSSVISVTFPPLKARTAPSTMLATIVRPRRPVK